MFTGLAGVLIAATLAAQAPVPPVETEAAPTAKAVRKEKKRAESRMPIDKKEQPAEATVAEKPQELVGDEDLLLIFQAFCALGAAAAVGAVALVPANLAFFVVLVLAVAFATPGIIIAGPILMLGVIVLLQALAAGVTVWAVGLTSEFFRARTIPLGPLAESTKNQPFLRGVLGLPWLPGTLGYLVGAGLAIGFGLALALPIFAASLVLLNAPAGNPAGIFAMMSSVMVGGILMMGAATVVAPPVAALAWHFTKVPVALDEQPAAR